jgi:hypothetical protein
MRRVTVASCTAFGSTGLRRASLEPPQGLQVGRVPVLGPVAASVDAHAGGLHLLGRHAASRGAVRADAVGVEVLCRYEAEIACRALAYVPREGTNVDGFSLGDPYGLEGARRGTRGVARVPRVV